MSENDPQVVVQIDLPAVYGMVQATSERLEAMDRKLDLSLAQGEVVKDHEGRLRLIERWKYALPPTAITAVVAAVAAAFK